MEEESIRFSRFRGRDNSVLTKQYRLNDSGDICKESAPNFTNGTAEAICIEKLSDIESAIDNLGTNQCISTGVFDDQSCEIVTKGKLDEERLAAGVRSRTSEYMVQPSPGIALLDHDISPYLPDHLRCDSPDALMSKLKKAVPGFTFVAYSGAGSCSSGITITATGEPYLGGGGLHVYIAVKDVDLKAFRRHMEVKLWNAGLGHISFARNGAMLVRCMIDTSVLSAGYWNFYTLSNDSFYAAPADERIYHVRCDNMFEGDLSADALGITACLYAYSHLSFSSGRFGRVCACHYHRLREYMFEHSEVKAILGATD